ncbi:MAG: ATP-binding protein [Bacteroidales bacterium]|nr:ATP-binding protein [Bacteroidales bacterium]
MGAKSVKDILRRKYTHIEWSERWQEAFGNPEDFGLWFIWGNSGNGKTSFVMQLANELSQKYQVFFNSLEEGMKSTLQQHLINNKVTGKIVFDTLPIEELMQLHRRYKVVIIDSVQASNAHYIAWQKLRQKLGHRLLIVISQADKKQPIGRTALRLKFDADLKLYVEGFKAISNGRYNPGGELIIWPEGYAKYYLNKVNEENYEPQPDIVE